MSRAQRMHEGAAVREGERLFAASLGASAQASDKERVSARACEGVSVCARAPD